MTTLSEQLNADVRAVEARIRPLITPNHVRHGWNVADLLVSIDETGVSWSVRLLGPVSTDVERHGYSAPTSHPAIHQTKWRESFRLYVGTHGTLHAQTADELVGLASDWLGAVCEGGK